MGELIVNIGGLRRHLLPTAGLPFTEKESSLLRCKLDKTKNKLETPSFKLTSPFLKTLYLFTSVDGTNFLPVCSISNARRKVNLVSHVLKAEPFVVKRNYISDARC